MKSPARVRISKRAMLRKHHEIQDLANRSSILFDVNRTKFNTFANNHNKQIQAIMDEFSELAEKYFEVEEKDGKKQVKYVLDVKDVNGKPTETRVPVCKPFMTVEAYEKEVERIENEMVVFVEL